MNRLRIRRPLAVVALAAAVAIPAAGCGGSSDSSSASSSNGGGGGGDKVTTLNVGIVGIAPDASMYLGMKKGFFAKQGLKVVPKISGGGAAVIPGVVSGGLQVGSSNPVSILLATEKGLPLQVVAGQNEAPASASDTDHVISGVLVRKDSPITSAKDLAGKTIAVNTLQNIGDVTIKGALAKQGVAVDGIKFLEIPFPDMLAALDSKRVDAAWVLDPFLSLGKAQGDRMVLANFVEAAPRLPLTAYFVSKSYASAHPDVVKGFRTAMTEASDYATQHPDEVRSIVTTFTKIPPEAAQKMALPVFTTQIDQGAMTTLAQMMQRFGLVQDAPDVNAVFGPAFG
ncbi:MAG TPA: ABC transporter substrate-binding protein [Baekduia sp.]|nr:ABC transporter substrate-binding protein [Baekduia sp.]